MKAYIRKSWFVILSLIMLLILSCFAMADEEITIIQSGSCGENVTWKLDSARVLTISGTGEMQNADIQQSVVAPWFFHRNSITKVVIEEGVTYIGDYAFCLCESLISISIPNSVTNIGVFSFMSCPLLTTFEISPDHPTLSIVDGALIDKKEKSLIYHPRATKEKKYQIPQGITAIADAAFMYCYKLKNITIPDSVTYIGDSAFGNCYKLKNITIPDSVTYIGDGAFMYCYKLKNVTIPDSVTIIGDYAFSNCIRLKSITIPDGVTTIGYRAFDDCYRLRSITIPESVTSIGEGAFDDYFDNFTIYGTAGSYAETYANENGYIFVER